MSKFTVEFNCDNAVFSTYKGVAIGDILQSVSEDIMCSDFDQPDIGIISDGNGNNIGVWAYVP